MKLMLTISALLLSGLAFASTPTDVQNKAGDAKTKAEREIQQARKDMKAKGDMKKEKIQNEVGDEYSKLKKADEEAAERQ